MLIASQAPATRFLVSPRAVELTGRLLASPLLVWLSRKGWFRWIARRIEQRTVPHIFAHYAARKATLEKEVHKAISAGYQQVVVVGGGFDTLAIRLKEVMPKLTVFEIDHPSTQDVKKSRAPKTTVQFIAADLRHQSVSQSLKGSEFKPDLPAIFVIEGLLMYLEETDVRVLLEDLIGGPRRFVFTAMNLDSDGRPGFKHQSRKLHEWLERRGEPFLWGCPPETMGEFLSSCKLNLIQTFDHSAMRQLLELSAELAEGEVVYVAEGCGS